MTKKYSLNEGLITFQVWVWQATSAWAQNTGDPMAVSDEFSKKTLEIIQGPLLKVLAAFVLLVGIAGLLRGRPRLAISCGIAFILILFLPILLGRV
jgi:hypothetical protein